MLRLLQALLLAVKKGCDYYKPYYSGEKIPKNASDYCAAYIAYMRVFATYKVGRNNTYQTTVQVRPPDFARFSVNVHNSAERARIAQNGI